MSSTNVPSNSASKLSLKNLQFVSLQVSLILFSCVFLFSGFVKAIDPLGSTYKFEDYFRAFGGVFEMLTTISFPLAVLLSSIELIIGLNLLFRVQLRYTLYSAIAFMAVMTGLTLYIAFKKNLVTDCGCFGDALLISNWATFYKNIVLAILLAFVVFFQKAIRPIFTPKARKVLLPIFIAAPFLLSAYCYRNLPLIDFLPYKIGVNIPDAMVVPDSVPKDKYETTFIYEKNGEQKEFTLENYPKGDSAWKFVDQKTVLVSSGFKPKIHDFSIVNEEFEDITEGVLFDNGYTYLLIVHDLSTASVKGALQAEELYKKAIANGAKFYALTSSSDNDVHAFKQANNLTFPFCKTDRTALKTIIRANPGLIIIKNGTIIEKKNWRDF